MTIQRIAMLTVHTSPLAAMGGKKTGGMNVYIREVAQEFARQGITVDIFTRRVAPVQEYIDYGLGDGIRVININAGPAAVLAPNDVYPHVSQFTAGVIAFATRQNIQYRIIYSHYWLSGWVAKKLKEVWGTPFIQMFHTLGQMKQRIGSGSTSLPDVRVVTETQIVHWASRIIAATPAEHAQLLWLYRADRRKISIIPPGVDQAKFTPMSQRKARQILGLRQDCHLFLFVGRIEPLKAVDTIIEALSILRAERRDLLKGVCFAIIGGDPNDPSDNELMRLRHMVDELQLTQTVDFLGAKDHQLLPIYYAASTAVIVPSDYESFGMVALESMATGTPVIASEVGGLAYLVKDRETGFHIPVRDPDALARCMQALIQEPKIQKLLSQNAAAFARRYSWRNIADQLVAEMETVLDERLNPRKN